MKIYPDLQTSLSGPVNRGIKIRCCTFDVWVTRIFLIRSITNWYSDGIETGSSNLLEVRYRHPCVPVALEDGFGIRNVFAERVLVNDRGVERLKE
jgi:hypothetical protein